MNYFNFKRYKFSTVAKYIVNIGNNLLKVFKSTNFRFYDFKKIYKYLDIRRFDFKVAKYIDPRRFNFKVAKYVDPRIYNYYYVKKIKFLRSNFLLFHLPASIIFFGFLYLAIPTFYNYDKSNIESLLCNNKNIECLINGKVSYSFYPTPRIKIKDLIVNELTKKKKTLITVNNAAIKLSFKNLLAKEKHKFESILLNNFEINLDFKNLKKYENILKSKVNSIPIILSKGKIIFFDKKNYVAQIKKTNINLEIEEDSLNADLTGEFLNDNLYLELSNKKIDNNKMSTDIILKMSNMNFLIKTNLINLEKDKTTTTGNFLIKQNKNQIAAIFDYKNKNKELIINKSNLKNPFLGGEMTGKFTLLPYFYFDLDLNLNSINFTKLYNYFLTLNSEDQIKLFKINNKINGILNLSANKIYSSYNLVKSLEAKMLFNNGNVLIERFLFNLGKLGAADLIGEISNEKKFSNFKFESNIFVDNKKKFSSKFGIYDKENLPSNFFVSGNFDLENKKAFFYEILDNEKVSDEDVDFIEKEFNYYMFEDDFNSLFLFPKFKDFVKSISSEVN